jgi:hypothetical protein
MTESEELQMLKRQRAIEQACRNQDIISPTDLSALIANDVDEQASTNSIAQAVQRRRQQSPWMFRSSRQDGGNVGPGKVAEPQLPDEILCRQIFGPNTSKAAHSLSMSGPEGMKEYKRLRIIAQRLGILG